MPEEDNSAKRFSPTISGLTRFIFVGLGLMYAIGLLIVNLNLRTKGLVQLDLARPGYLLVGGLYTLLVGSLLSLYYLTRAELEELRGGKVWRKITWERVGRWGYLAGAILGFFVFSLFITGWKLGLVSGAKYLLAIVFIALVYVPSRRDRATFRNFLRDGKFGPGLFVEILTTIMAVLITLAAYSLWVYPHILRGVGGAYEPIVELVLSASSSIPWKSATIATSSDGKLVGPVGLVLETDSELFVESESQSKSQNAGGKKTIIAIRRESLSAILYTWESEPPPLHWLDSEGGAKMPPQSPTPTPSTKNPP